MMTLQNFLCINKGLDHISSTIYPQTYAHPLDSVCCSSWNPQDPVDRRGILPTLALLRLFCSKAAKTVLTPASEAIGYLHREGALAGLARRRPVNGIGYRQTSFQRNGVLRSTVLRFNSAIHRIRDRSVRRRSCESICLFVFTPARELLDRAAHGIQCGPGRVDLLYENPPLGGAFDARRQCAGPQGNSKGPFEMSKVVRPFGE